MQTVPTTEYCVYWIHRPEHTDIRKDGYVGVTKRFKRRLVEHSKLSENRHLKFAITKYGWDNLVKEKVLIAEEDYCLDIEFKLRPENNVGWNLVKGGGMPPISRWNLGKKCGAPWNKGIAWSEEKRKEISDGVKKLWNDDQYREHMSKVHKGQISPMTGKKHSEETLKRMSESKLSKKLSKETKEKMGQAHRGKIHPKVTCPHCKKVGGETGMKSWHFDNCRFKEIVC